MRHDLQLSPVETEYWTEKVREGWDEPLKGMLVALAPRLDRVNLVACVSGIFLVSVQTLTKDQARYERHERLI